MQSLSDEAAFSDFYWRRHSGARRCPFTKWQLHSGGQNHPGDHTLHLSHLGRSYCLDSIFISFHSCFTKSRQRIFELKNKSSFADMYFWKVLIACDKNTRSGLSSSEDHSFYRFRARFVYCVKNKQENALIQWLTARMKYRISNTLEYCEQGPKRELRHYSSSKPAVLFNTSSCFKWSVRKRQK